MKSSGCARGPALALSSERARWGPGGCALSISGSTTIKGPLSPSGPAPQAHRWGTRSGNGGRLAPMSGKWQSSWRCSPCPESLAGRREGSVPHLAVGSWPASPGPCQLQTCTPLSEAASPGSSTQPDRGFRPCPGLQDSLLQRSAHFNTTVAVRGQLAPPR